MFQSKSCSSCCPEMQLFNSVQQQRALARVRDKKSHRTVCVQQAVGRSTQILQYSRKLKIEQGEVNIRPMKAADFRGVSLLLTKAFAGTVLAASLKNIKEYITKLLSMTYEDGVVLVGRLSPDSQESDDEQESGVEGGRSGRLITVVTLSFNENNRDKFKSLKPHPDAAYLSNMAVDRKFRRQGVAQYMLEACEELVSICGKSEIQLHVLSTDPAAEALYVKCGYEEMQRDSVFQRLQGQTPKILMKKHVII